MGDINFLSTQDSNRKNNEKKKEEKRTIEWSEPIRDEQRRSLPAIDGARLAKYSGWFSFLKKDKNLKNKIIDKKELKRSRAEVLELIKEQKREEAKFGQTNPIKTPHLAGQATAKAGQAEKDKRESKFLPWLKDLFKRKHKIRTVEVDLKKIDLKEKIEDIRPETKIFAEKAVIKNQIFSPETTPAPEKERAEIVSDIKKEKKSEEQGILETNLIRDEAISFFNWKGNVATLILYVVFMGLIIGGAYGGIFFWGENEKKKKDITVIDFDKIENEIRLLEKDAEAIYDFQKRFKLVSELFNKHIYWTNFFNFLEDNTIKDVYYFSFSGDNEGTYTLDAKAKDFKAIANQVEAMRANEYVKEAGIEGGALGADDQEAEAVGVDFKLKFKVNTDLFTK